MLEKALLYDSNGRPIKQEHKTNSNDWDEVQEFCRNVYMPYQVIPLEKNSKPDAIMHSMNIGRITVTRFSYGTSIHLKDFDPDAGNILVLTTIRGGLRHMVDKNNYDITNVGDSFVVDCSRAEYWLEGDGTHLQLNLTIPHALMEDTAFKWYGFIPDDVLWTQRVKFGGTNSSWIALMEYILRAIGQVGPNKPSEKELAHLEELICHELLKNWALIAGIDLSKGARCAAPQYVRAAEDYMEKFAKDAPTLGEVAMFTGVSVRALSGGFKRFRGITPGQFLREQRLNGVRNSLLSARDGETVSQIVSDWGYSNFGIFARSYKQRFGENPSQTLSHAVKNLLDENKF